MPPLIPPHRRLARVRAPATYRATIADNGRTDTLDIDAMNAGSALSIVLGRVPSTAIVLLLERLAK